MKVRFTGAVLSAALIATPVALAANDVKPVELTETELAAVQSRNYDVSYDVLFPSVMATLQSLGYMNIVASRDAGTASAETEAKGKVIYNILWGFGKKKRTQRASIFMEQQGVGKSVLKLKLTMLESKSRGLIGGGFSDGQPIRIGEPYDMFYTALGAEVARRGGAVTPAESAPASTTPK